MKIKLSPDSFINISWGALAALLAGVLAFSAWMTSIDTSSALAHKKIEELSLDNKENVTILHSIDMRLQRIEVILEEVFFKKQKQNKEK